MQMNKNAFPYLYLSLGVLLCPSFCLSTAFGQATYSYLDENGTRVLTNIAPTKTVADLKISGMPPAPEPKPVPKVSKPPKSIAQAKTARRTPQPAVRPVAGVSKPTAETAAITIPDLVRTVGAPASQPAIVPPLHGPGAPGDLGLIIDRYATQYQLDPKLVRSVIAAESGFQRKAVSSKGALGLMQLMPSTAARLGVKDPFDPEQNIRGGTKHLRFLMDTFDNNLDLSLAAYNAGENLVQRLGRVPNIPETRDYVRIVTARYGKTFMDQAHVPLAESSAPPYPLVFRYLDPNGVLVLTNVPPSGSSGGFSQGISGNTQLPQ
jgi:hypothetical protein